MDILKGLALPAAIVISPFIALGFIIGNFFIGVILFFLQVGILTYITAYGVEEEFVKKSRKLWKKIKSVF